MIEGTLDRMHNGERFIKEEESRWCPKAHHCAGATLVAKASIR